MSNARNILICFDAFGTLFSPRRPISQQYGEVARSLGLKGFTDDDVNRAFKIAFKQESQLHPNFGKASGLNPEKWWASTIVKTFQPLVGATPLPAELVPRLLHRFKSNEGYNLQPGVKRVLDRVRDLKRQVTSDRIIVGVLTNSDNRVPDILDSLGISTSPLRYNASTQNPTNFGTGYHIDFAVMSFDVGYEKPHRRIFEAAEEMLETRLRHNYGLNTDDFKLDHWQKIYIGDEYDKDVRGACDAGWNAMLVGPRDHRVPWLDVTKPLKLRDLFISGPAVGIDSLEYVTHWLD